MSGLPITLTFTFDDMAQAERAIAAVRRATEFAPEPMGALSEVALPTTDGDTGLSGSGRTSGTGSAGREGSIPSGAPKMDGGAVAAVKGQARPASVVDAEPSPSSTILPMPKPLRPNCQKPDHCSGYGRNHCHACKVMAAAEVEAA